MTGLVHLEGSDLSMDSARLTVVLCSWWDALRMTAGYVRHLGCHKENLTSAYQRAYQMGVLGSLYHVVNYCKHEKHTHGAEEVTQWLRALAILADDPSLSPGTQVR